MSDKTILTLAILSAIVSGLIGGYVGSLNTGNGDAYLRGITNYDQIDAADGFSVDNTIVIDGSGNVDAPVTSTTGTFSSTLDVTATTTLSDGLKLNNPGICLEFYATSTETRTHMQASTTATIEGVDGVMMWGYGSCSY